MGYGRDGSRIEYEDDRKTDSYLAACVDVPMSRRCCQVVGDTGPLRVEISNE